ncbi:MAG TPA: hypothetical protein VFP94_06665 [Terriglobales bacterium]|nr:hypothetical protein [Terriglobales bacterium]
MKRVRSSAVGAGVLFLAGLLAAQTRTMVMPPVPPNPYDPVSKGVQLLSTPAERAAALNLLSQAGQNYEFGQQGTPALAVSVSLQSAGGLTWEGLGTMTDVWSGGRRTWWSDFANQTSGLAYPLASNPVPLRVAQAREALFRPLSPTPTWQEIRAGNTTLAGVPVTCVLVNRAATTPSRPGRDWREAEYCINANRQLLLASPGPGYFYQYDYTQPLVYAGHVLPSAIHMIEGRQTVMNIEVARMGPPSGDDLQGLRHSPPHPGLLSTANGGNYLSMDQYPETQAAVLTFTVGVKGNILEAEAIPNGFAAFEQQALWQLRLRRFPPRRTERVFLLREGGQ